MSLKLYSNTTYNVWVGFTLFRTLLFLSYRDLGAIVFGSVVGFFVVCVIVSLLIYWCIRWHKRKKSGQTDRRPLLAGIPITKCIKVSTQLYAVFFLSFFFFVCFCLFACLLFALTLDAFIYTPVSRMGTVVNKG